MQTILFSLCLYLTYQYFFHLLDHFQFLMGHELYISWMLYLKLYYYFLLCNISHSSVLYHLGYHVSALEYWQLTDSDRHIRQISKRSDGQASFFLESLRGVSLHSAMRFTSNLKASFFSHFIVTSLSTYLSLKSWIIKKVLRSYSLSWKST